MGQVNCPGEMILVLGGARSGKSAYAQKLAQSQELPVTYLASAIPLDEEMRQRIVRHRETRPKEWTTVEAPYSADKEVIALCSEKRLVIWDCITVFLTNLMLKGSQEGEGPDEIEASILSRFQMMFSEAEGLPGTLIAVSNEVGLGLVPEYPLGRNFRDLAGRVNQLLAQQADKVFLMVAGLPLQIKGAGVTFN